MEKSDKLAFGYMFLAIFWLLKIIVLRNITIEEKDALEAANLFGDNVKDWMDGKAE